MKSVSNPEPTLAFDRDDVGLMLGNCGSLVYKGGFVPHHLVENGSEDKHFEDSPRPLQVIKNDDVAKGNDPWPLPSWQAHLIPREYLEEDPEFLQTLPYILVFNDMGELLAYNRASGDPRLTDKWSIGIGGHVDISDVDYMEKEGNELIDVSTTLRNAAQREFHEETGLIPRSVDQMHTAGLIHYPNDDVGKVHLGIVMAVVVGAEELDNKIGSSREVGEYEMLVENDDPDEKLSGEIEGWSEILFRTEVPSVLRTVCC